DRAVGCLDTFFRVEMPAFQQWCFGPREARRIDQPALVVLGEKSPGRWPGWREGHELLLEWLPRAEPFVLPGATHMLHLENPTGSRPAGACWCRTGGAR